MNFECHITVSTADADKAKFFVEQRMGAVKWKHSEIARDPVLGDDTYFYLTAHATAYEVMHLEMKYAVRWLGDHNVPVLREKIELIMFDTKEKPLSDTHVKALATLEAVLCDPEGKCSIDGSDADRRHVDEALAALRHTRQVTNFAHDEVLLNELCEEALDRFGPHRTRSETFDIAKTYAMQMLRRYGQ